jgi:hypothetical protein
MSRRRRVRWHSSNIEQSSTRTPAQLDSQVRSCGQSQDSESHRELLFLRPCVGGPDIDVDDVGMGERANCAGRAAVVAGDGQAIGAGEVEGAVIDHVVGRTKSGVDLGNAADERDRGGLPAKI